MAPLTEFHATIPMYPTTNTRTWPAWCRTTTSTPTWSSAFCAPTASTRASTIRPEAFVTRPPVPHVRRTYVRLRLSTRVDQLRDRSRVLVHQGQAMMPRLGRPLAQSSATDNADRSACLLPAHVRPAQMRRTCVFASRSRTTLISGDCDASVASSGTGPKMCRRRVRDRWRRRRRDFVDYVDENEPVFSIWDLPCHARNERHGPF